MLNELISSRYSRHLLVLFYVLAGINHFIYPSFYLPLIPTYFGDIWLVNLFAGIAEVLLGLLVIPQKTRRWALYGIVLMLIAFIPSHLYFIQIGGCVEEGLCVPAWVAWVRLIIVHPLLILWAWKLKD